MQQFLQLFSIILSGFAVGVADSLVKKASFANGFLAAFKTPWMLGAGVLYVIQIFFFIYVFSNGWKLGIVSNINVVFFSLTTIAIGYFFFHESLSAIQLIGIAVAIIGVTLMNA
jgi:multidrug transporter EmrE-like cation transporter